VLRTGKRWAALATLLADAGKGYVAVRVAGDYFGIQLFPVLAGLGVVLGHMFPVWLRFKGGKGVAAFIGVLFAFRPPVAAVLTCLTWLTMAWATRYSSVAALAAAIVAPLYFLLLGTTLFALLAAVLATLIVFAHRANIARLLRGEEPRIGHA